MNTRTYQTEAIRDIEEKLASNLSIDDMETQTSLRKRRYQEQAINEIEGGLSKHDRLVLDAACNAGKTYMGIRICEWWIETQKTPIWWSTHSTIDLLNQTFERFNEELHNFSYTAWDPNGKGRHVLAGTKEIKRGRLPGADVILSIPQQMENKKNLSLKLIIVDEAHHNLTGRRFTNPKSGIIMSNPGVKILGLTGTANSFFEELPTKRPLGATWECVTITMQKIIMEDPNVYSKSKQYSYQYSNGLITAIQDMVSFLDLKDSTYNTCMWVCHTQSDAMDVHRELQRLGLTSKVSTSDCDKKSADIRTFRKEPVGNLVVCNRGKIGFDCAELYNVVDCSTSPNSDQILQTFSRSVRKSKRYPSFIKKFVAMSPNTKMARVFSAQRQAMGQTTERYAKVSHQARASINAEANLESFIKTNLKIIEAISAQAEALHRECEANTPAEQAAALIDVDKTTAVVNNAKKMNTLLNNRMSGYDEVATMTIPSKLKDGIFSEGDLDTIVEMSWDDKTPSNPNWDIESLIKFCQDKCIASAKQLKDMNGWCKVHLKKMAFRYYMQLSDQDRKYVEDNIPWDPNRCNGTKPILPTKTVEPILLTKPVTPPNPAPAVVTAPATKGWWKRITKWFKK
jgi:superfamily II DNA or RNA helicase